MVTRGLSALPTPVWCILLFPPHTVEKEARENSIILFYCALFLTCFPVPACDVSGALVVIGNVCSRRQEPHLSPFTAVNPRGWAVLRGCTRCLVPVCGMNEPLIE